MKIITGRTGTNHVTSDDDRALHAGIFGAGSYVLSTGSKLAVTIASSNTIRIGSGDIVHQGTHARIPYGDYEDVTIDNGTSGYYRNDLIVARYTKASGIESVELAVIKGTPSTTAAVTPEYNTGSILQGATVSDMPLYVVALNGVNIASVTAQFAPITIGLMVYPVGTIYMSVNDTDPGLLFGGSWERWGEGRIPVGVDEAEERFKNAGMTNDKNWTHSHTVTVKGHALTVDEMPSHTHQYYSPPALATSGYESASGVDTKSANTGRVDTYTQATGGGQEHTHNAEITSATFVPPYITCYMWKRVA